MSEFETSEDHFRSQEAEEAPAETPEAETPEEPVEEEGTDDGEGDAAEPGGDPEEPERPGGEPQDDAEGAGDAPEAPGDPGAAADDARTTVTVDGEEREVTVAELKKHYGQDKAASQKFREASEKERRATALAQWLIDPSQAPSGLSKPVDAIIQLWAAKHTNGDRDRAEELFIQRVIDPYIEMRLKETDEPWRRAQRQADYYRTQAEEERRARQESENRANQAHIAQRVETWWQAALAKEKLPEAEYEAQEGEKILVQKIKQGETLTKAEVEALAKAAADRRRLSQKASLGSMTLDELRRENPELAKRLLKELDAERQKTESPTRRGAMPRGRVRAAEEPAKPPRRARRPESQAEYTDTLEALQAKGR